MVTRRKRRSAAVPEQPSGSLSIQMPPEKAEPASIGNVLMMVVPMLGSTGVMIFMALQTASNTRALLMGGGMLVAMLGMVGFNMYRQFSQYRTRVVTQRREYLSYLAETRDAVRKVAKKQRAYYNWVYPDPDALVTLAANGSRLWSREGGTYDLFAFRYGSGTQPLGLIFERPPIDPMTEMDVVCLSAMDRFINVHDHTDNVGKFLFLGDYSHIEVAGEGEAVYDEMRAIMMHLACFIDPSKLKIAVLCSADRLGDWEWVKWMPQARSSTVRDAVGPGRMISTDPAELAEMIGTDIAMRGAFRFGEEIPMYPHLLLVCDGAEFPASSPFGSASGVKGVTIMSRAREWTPMTSHTTLRLLIHPNSDRRGADVVDVVTMDSMPEQAFADRLSAVQAEAVARRMTPFATQQNLEEADTPVGRSDESRQKDLMELIGIGDIRDFDPEKQWRRREGPERLAAPFGVTPEGQPVVLDIKESSEKGMGPHGLLIGATGSGKSEVLRTLVLALALTHSPEQLNLVLVDFKGGATFAGMSDLPHVSAMISNLESELSLVDRMQDALQGEMVRRQEMLRQAGNYANVTTYEADRIAGKHEYPPLPALFIVLDEFTEMLMAKPEFGEVFIMIGRLGRSLSVHLLLASQKMDLGKARGLESHLSYRVALKTFTENDSREVLGIPDAAKLPPLPGSGFLKAGGDGLVRFRASYVAAPPPARTLASISEASTAGAPSAPIEILPFTVAPVITREDTLGDKEEVDQNQEIVLAGDEVWADMSEMDIAVAKMKGKGYPAHQVWLPPLEVPDTFATLMPDLGPDPELGFVSRAWRDSGTLRVPLGTVDLPLEQRRETLVLDLSGAGGNFALVGGPQTGKSTALRTIVQALSLTYTPQEVHFYVMDFGGGTFAGFAGAPHVAGIATRDTEEVRTRMLAEVAAIMDDRERYFRQNGIDSMDTYRRGRLEGRYDDGYGDVFLVIDGWGALRSEFDSLDRQVATMMSRGLSLGVHLIVSAARWMDFRSEAQDLFGSRLELHTANPKESIVHREGAARIPKGRPGRGIDMAGHEMMIGLPRADAEQDPTTVSQGVAYTVEKIREHLVAGEGPKLRLLPEQITIDSILEQLPEQQILPRGGGDMILGVEESRLGPLVFNTRTESHLYLFGDSRTGKSTFLRSIMKEITRLYTPGEARIITIDMRRTLMDDVPKDHTLRYITNHDSAMKDMREMAQFLRKRLPGPEVTAEQIRERSWWSGPELWVLVDDYDLAATMSGNPLMELVDLLPQASDIGLHLVITRRMGGAARATFEKVLQMMGDLAVTGILLSGNPSEGAIINGVKPKRAIPGRAQVIHRDLGVVAAQMAWTPPTR
ncbi:type VII secretion protein EccCa [Schaalia odontolytica]|uniref:Type VII secretion system protein EccCa1 n=1 Tax=Schaalia odontolytica TaxID=1660 RepID=A0A2X0U5D7_9ACTO|nr:type VII secretion protein EccCa [Schaalia odontolytica]WMS28073.1 type VII secretion protein EccCa [Schaalia odontolytica]SPT56336.1 Type VII secretion system protein EccCa1 [Schaalia odontolytica]